MQYQGSKSRICKPIAEVISDALSRREVPNSEGYSYGDFSERERERERERESNKTFVSLFCGSCAVEAKVAGYDRIICNDNHEYLIALLKAVQEGYELPEHISEEQYKYIKEHKDENKALAGFVGFGCSFGGKWFGGYARNKTGTNYADQSKRSLLKDMVNLMTAESVCQDYKDVIIPRGSVVYANPPYKNTTTYQNRKFNSEEFWNFMRELSKDNTVYISEQVAPDDFTCIWEKPFTRTLDRNKENQFKVIEKLFAYQNT